MIGEIRFHLMEERTATQQGFKSIIQLFSAQFVRFSLVGIPELDSKVETEMSQV